MKNYWNLNGDWYQLDTGWAPSLLQLGLLEESKTIRELREHGFKETI